MAEQLAMCYSCSWVVSVKSTQSLPVPHPFISQAITVYSQSAKSGALSLTQKAIKPGFWMKPSMTLSPWQVQTTFHPPSTSSLSLIGAPFTTLSSLPRYRIRSRLVKWITPSVSQSHTAASLLCNDGRDTLITKIFTYNMEKDSNWGHLG